MKPLYLTLCVVLAFFTLLFIYFHIEYTPITIDKKIHEHTTSLLKAIKKIVKSNTPTQKSSERISPKIWKHNLFDPLRGEMESSSNTKPFKEITNMELIGICNTNTLKGAIILQKKNNLRSISSRNSSSNSKPKRFFILEERLPNGYTLEKVEPDSVTLGRGNEQVTLKLKFDDNDTTSRVSSVASSSVKTQLNKIKKAKKGRGDKKPKISVKVTPINNKPSKKEIMPKPNSK